MLHSEPRKILEKSRPRVSILDFPAENIATLVREKLVEKQVEDGIEKMVDKVTEGSEETRVETDNLKSPHSDSL